MNGDGLWLRAELLRPHLSSSGCTHLLGVISCLSVSLIMWTAGA
jgi:hypothetical protein